MVARAGRRRACLRTVPLLLPGASRSGPGHGTSWCGRGRARGARRRFFAGAGYSSTTRVATTRSSDPGGSATASRSGIASASFDWRFAHRVPVVPAVSVGAHETVIVLARGEWVAKLLGFDRMIPPQGDGLSSWGRPSVSFPGESRRGPFRRRSPWNWANRSTGRYGTVPRRLRTRTSSGSATRSSPVRCRRRSTGSRASVAFRSSARCVVLRGWSTRRAAGLREPCGLGDGCRGSRRLELGGAALASLDDPGRLSPNGGGLEPRRRCAWPRTWPCRPSPPDPRPRGIGRPTTPRRCWPGTTAAWT